MNPMDTGKLIAFKRREKGLTQEQLAQRLEKQKESLFGMMCMTMGAAMLVLSQLFSGTNFRDFISGVLLGLAVGEMLAGLYVMGRTFGKQ